MKKRGSVTLAAVMMLALVACGASKLQKQLDLGEKYLNEANYDEALAAYNEAIEIDPCVADSYVGKAKAYEGIASTATSTDDEISSLYSAYKTLDEVSNTDIELVYMDESLTQESFTNYETKLYDSILNVLGPYLEELNRNGDFDKIRELEKQYGSDFDIFDYYLNNYLADITVSGVLASMAMDGSDRIVTSLNEIPTGAGMVFGIYLDSDFELPNGETTRWLGISYEEGVDIHGFFQIMQLGDPLTLTGHLEIAEEFTGLNRYRIRMPQSFFDNY